MVEKIYSEMKGLMQKTLDYNQIELSKIRTGRASTSMLDSVQVDYYGTAQPLKNVSHVSAPEAQLIVITPFDPSSLEMIESSILAADLGMDHKNYDNLQCNIKGIDNLIDVHEILEKVENREPGDSGTWGPFYHQEDE